MTPDDYPLLDGWMRQPHWLEWWGDRETELGYIRDMVEGEDSTRPFLFLLDGEPAGYIQYWFICDNLVEPWLSEAPWMTRVPADSIGIDLSIGDAGWLSRGLGSTALRLFAERRRAEGHKSILIDPDLANARAIRAYEKAGFRELIVSRESSKDGGGTMILKFDASHPEDGAAR